MKDKVIEGIVHNCVSQIDDYVARRMKDFITYEEETGEETKTHSIALEAAGIISQGIIYAAGVIAATMRENNE